MGVGNMRSNWRGKVLLVLLSTCFAFVIAFAAGEVYIRLTKPYVTPDTVREASLEYEATFFARNVFPQMAQSKPMVTRVNPYGWVRINARGYRGRDFAVPKLQGTIRIVFLGGSAAFDVCALEGRDWPHLVEEKLHAWGHEKAEVINAAIPGHATWDSLGRLYAEIWMFEPDYLVIYHAWNDIKYFVWLSPEQNLLRGYRPALTSEVRSLVRNPFMYYTGPLDRVLCHSQLYVRLRWRYWSWRLGKVGLEGTVRAESVYSDTYSEWGPRQYELNLRLIVDTARHIGATPIFLTQARLVTAGNSTMERKRICYNYVHLSHEALVQAFEDCDKAIFAVAETKHVPVLDLADRFSGRNEFFLDHAHPTSAGSEAIAKAVADFLAEIMGERKP